MRGRWVLTPVLASCLGGCSFDAVDSFSKRSVGYNLEAEQSQDSTMLLNIVRGAMRRPPEFTGLQTVTGTASLSGSGQVSFPFGAPPRPAPDAGQLTAGITGGPTFALAVLDTQEFHRGIMAPIDLKTIDLFIQERYARTMLFNLLISRIVVKQGDKVIELDNYPSFDDSLDPFQLAVEYLVNLGLTTETVKSVTPYGPALGPDEARNIEHAAKAADAKLDLAQLGWCDLGAGDALDDTLRRFQTPALRGPIVSWCKLKADAKAKPGAQDAAGDDLTVAFACPSKQDPARQGSFAVCFPSLPAILYRLQKSDKTAQFCFESRPKGEIQKWWPLFRGKNGCADDRKGAGADKAHAQAPAELREGLTNLQLGPELRNAWLALSEKRLDRHLRAKLAGSGEEVFDFSKPITSLELVPRSPEGVIYYLGEVVRRQRFRDQYPGLDANSPPVVMVKYGSLRGEDIPLDQRCETPGERLEQPASAGAADSPYVCEPMFRVTDDPDQSFVSVNYDGTWFGISRDNETGTRDAAVGRTYQVLDLATKLVNLNRSAKDEPTTSVFTVIQP